MLASSTFDVFRTTTITCITSPQDTNSTWLIFRPGAQFRQASSSSSPSSPSSPFFSSSSSATTLCSCWVYSSMRPKLMSPSSSFKGVDEVLAFFPNTCMLIGCLLSIAARDLFHSIRGGDIGRVRTWCSGMYRLLAAADGECCWGSRRTDAKAAGTFVRLAHSLCEAHASGSAMTKINLVCQWTTPTPYSLSSLLPEGWEGERRGQI